MVEPNALHQVSTNPSPGSESSKQDRANENENEGLCFTSGVQGLPFGAGVIHAYLAAGRGSPRVVAGISMGSLTTAAFQRAFREATPASGAEVTEDVRWRWYRKYLRAISERPLDLIWSGIPDQSDFFARFIPVKDSAPQKIPDVAVRNMFTKEELSARRDLALFVGLGRWLAKLPLRVSSVAGLIINYVRWQEKYGHNPFRRFLFLVLSLLKVIFVSLIHNSLHPEWFNEKTFAGSEGNSDKKFNRVISFLGVALFLLPIVIAIRLIVARSQAQELNTVFAAFITVLLPLMYWWSSKNIRPLFGWTLFGLSWCLILSIILPLLNWLVGIIMWIEVHLSNALFVPYAREHPTSTIVWLAKIGVGKRVYEVLESLRPGLHDGLIYITSLLFIAVAVLTVQVRWRTKSFEFWKAMAACIGVAGAILLGIFGWHRLVDASKIQNGIAQTIVVYGERHWSYLLSGLTLFLAYQVITHGELLGLVFENLNLHKGIIHNYYLRFALFDLFQEDGNAPVLGIEPFPVVLVAAPLQIVPATKRQEDPGAYQVWAKPGTSLIDVLTATLAVPGIYEPVHLKAETGKKAKTAETQKATGDGALEAWELPSGFAKSVGELDLVDGSVIRQNPLPALFSFIAKEPKIASQLSSSMGEQTSKLHVVYSVPIDPPPPEKQDCNVSIVDVGLAALKLSRRRDTQLEVHQTNLLSEVERELRKVGGRSSRLNPIFVDEIAPSVDKDFANPINPTREDILGRVASGCRATLEVLYADKLATWRNNAADEYIPCEQLMQSELSRPGCQRQQPQSGLPGLPEVCTACTRKLKARPLHRGKAQDTSSNTWSSQLPDNPNYHQELPQLVGARPRIVFVASGGVFRGSFHVGMISALLAAHIKPDLIVGASVGTIMGGALAAAFCAPSYEEAIVHFEKLTQVLLSVDQEIAFTKVFKNAVRDLGIRAIGVNISPSKIRKMVLDGSEHDASFAAVGAPSALIDAISRLLLIPHRATGDIAAEFVAGHVTAATKALLQQLKSETLRQLQVEYALIGTSLMQPTVRRLLNGPGVELGKFQPYQASRQIAIYGTTIDFWPQRPVLLGVGRPGLGPSYDFAEATLCSSAFPCVFAARRESDLYPGTGSPTTLFCDGGMFDNLPFLPAIEILAKVQSTHAGNRKGQGDGDRCSRTLEALTLRSQAPDLFIAGSLDVNLQTQPDIDNSLDNILEITERASALQNNIKIKSFEQVLSSLDEQVQKLVLNAQKDDGKQNAAKLNFKLLDQIVNASVLPVYPVDPQHLNGTFAFCASTGLNRERLKDSMSNGCFQTLRAFVDPGSSSSVYREDADSSLKRSLGALRRDKIPAVSWNESGKQPRGICKHFKLSIDPAKKVWPGLNPEENVYGFVCPFFAAGQAADEAAQKLTGQERRMRQDQADEVRSIYDRCIADPVHLSIVKEGAEAKQPQKHDGD